MSEDWDAVVIGGGAAGLSAAQMLGRSRRRTLVIDAGAPRNRTSAHLHGVLGHDGAEPSALLDRGRAEARRYGVEIVRGEVQRLTDEGDRIRVRRTDGGEATARVVVIASGVHDALPDVPGLREEWGRRVLHCPYCHGWEVAGRRLGVLATGPQSLHQAELVRQLSDDVVVFSAAAEPVDEAAHGRLLARGVRLVAEPVQRIEPGAALAVVTADGRAHEVDALFTGGAPSVPLDLLGDLVLERADAPGAPLQTGPTGATSHPRLFAAGNVVQPFGTIPVAMASGAMAGAGANAALVAEDGELAVARRTAARNGAWEARYAERARFWSGRVNATVADVVAALAPGTALDVGCGEGGDVVWLAEHGWRATGVDVAPSAVERARDLAASRGVRVELALGDGAASVEGLFDLVLASFLHSEEADFPRLRLLREAADRVAPGGRLLVVSHAAPPPWADRPHDHGPALVAPREELALLALDPDRWRVEIAEVRPRAATAPDGSRAELEDGVLLLRRVR